MKYFKSEIDGYITAIAQKDDHMVIRFISDGVVLSECSEEEYTEILSVLKTFPHAEGKGYKLKADLTWEAYDLPEPEEEELTADEALSIITGGES